MSEQPQGPGWWLASDGKYYPPEAASPAANAQGSAALPPGAVTGQPTRRRPFYTRWWFWLLAFLAVVFFLFLLLIALVAGESGDDLARDGTQQTEEPTDGDGARDEAPEDDDVAAGGDSDNGQPAEEEQATNGSASEAGTRDNPLPVGETATVGDWEVTVDNINTDADQIVAEANQFNDPPEGQYVVITLTVTYLGNDDDDEGFPAFDLREVISVENAQYSAGDTFAVAPDPSAGDAPTLEPGGTTTYNQVIDVPSVSGAVLFIEESLSFDDTRSYWAFP